MVHQDSSDDLGTKCQEVHAVLAADATRSHQLKVSFIGQGARLESLTGDAAINSARYLNAGEAGNQI